ncbi:MAG: hypothetical protein AABN34_24140 [Acidobacteriota bacterium]
MWKKTMMLVILTFGISYDVAGGGQNTVDQWDKTVALKQLPYCALVLRALIGPDNSSREIFLLMEPDQVTEGNLRLLSRVLSERYPPPLSLEVRVTTDVEQLASLATNSGHTAHPDNEARGKKEMQWAYYRRSEDVELFRYNPNYPKAGMKTVILKGKE